MAEDVKKEYNGSVGKLVVDGIIIVLLGLILAKVWAFELPEPIEPIKLPEEFRVVVEQPPVVVNFPETFKVDVDPISLRKEETVVINSGPDLNVVRPRTTVIEKTSKPPQRVLVKKVENDLNSINLAPNDGPKEIEAKVRAAMTEAVENEKKKFIEEVEAKKKKRTWFKPWTWLRSRDKDKKE